MAQLMPLPLIVSQFSKVQIGFTFLVPAHLGSPGKRAIKRVCVCVTVYNLNVITNMPVTGAQWVHKTDHMANKKDWLLTTSEP